MKPTQTKTKTTKLILGKRMTVIDLWEERYGKPRNRCLPPFAWRGTSK